MFKQNGVAESGDRWQLRHQLSGHRQTYPGSDQYEMYNVSDNPMKLTNLHDDGKHQAVEIPDSTPEPLDDVEQYRALEQ